VTSRFSDFTSLAQILRRSQTVSYHTNVELWPTFGAYQLEVREVRAIRGYAEMRYPSYRL
jgi:hypothetical protein